MISLDGVIASSMFLSGNFIYQWLFASNPDYLVATERAYFQLITIVSVVAWKRAMDNLKARRESVDRNLITKITYIPKAVNTLDDDGGKQ